MTLYADNIAKLLNLRSHQVSATIELFEGGNTVPFIARYRKEATGSLDEEQIRQVQGEWERLKALDERRQTILSSIEDQGKMTEELRTQILAAETMTVLEDLYLPYKPKRRTRASIAREKGLQGLADLILTQIKSQKTSDVYAEAYLNDQVETIEEALSGARDIVAETISDHPDIRGGTRQKAIQWGTLSCGKIDDANDERGVYQLYYQYEGRVDRMRPHQILAMNRGEDEKMLKVQTAVQERDWRGVIAAVFPADMRSPFHDELTEAIDDAAERLLLPAIDRDVRRELTETAEKHAIHVFATNLRALLSQPPLEGHVVMGLDPGFRTGCKVAVVDATGKLLDTTTIYPHEPQKRWKETLAQLKSLVEKYKITLISIGNGTASRETEQLAAELIHTIGGNLRYIITNEAGASVYSASPLARAEMPQLDVSLRGAVSIARRVQDPLAELVKIDPKSIGVGLYQHDVNQTELTHALDSVIESVVNSVGVEVNTASPALLTHVSGIGPKLAERIVAYRDETGPFKTRQELKKVSGLGAKAFEQSAGFLRIRNGDHPLDASAIHPESYAAASEIMKKAGIQMDMPMEEKRKRIDELKKKQPVTKLAEEIGVGVPTLTDIFEQLLRPGRDPRKDTPAPILRSDVLSMDDLLPGMRLKGTVRNVVDFGSFVDIGVKQDGLLHRTQVPYGTVLQVGDIIDIEIKSVEKDRGRISLGWIQD